MANKKLFKKSTPAIPKSDAQNNASGKAYSMTAKGNLAQLACTGCMNDTYYTKGEDQLKQVLTLSKQVEPEFLAKLALYSREKGYMKDMPALLCAVLSVENPELLKVVFPKVINNGKMVRNFVQIMRSGQVGRKSLGSAPKKLIQDWLNTSTSDYIFKNSVGAEPSMADVIKMVHPTPRTKEKEALFGYLIGKDIGRKYLPDLVKDFEDFKKGKTKVCPEVPFQMLTALTLTKQNWIEIAMNGGWHMVRINLNTFARHGVFEDKAATKHIIQLLTDETQIKKNKVFPYQLMTTFLNVDSTVPRAVKEALQDAMEIATANVPSFGTQTYIGVDVSGSMSSPITGHRAGSTTVTRCIDVAALIGVSIARYNKGSEIIPFDGSVRSLDMNYRDSVMSNAAKLAAMGGGATNCGAVLERLNGTHAKGDLVIYVSDNESWYDTNKYSYHGGTSMSAGWAKYKARNPKAKLVCIDLLANSTVQVKDSGSVLNIGGFSDAIFDVIKMFTDGDLKGNWTDVIDGIDIYAKKVILED